MFLLHLNTNAQSIDLEARRIAMGFDRIVKFNDVNCYKVYKNDLFGIADENLNILVACNNDYGMLEGDAIFVMYTSGKNKKYSAYDITKRKYILKDKRYISSLHELKIGNRIKGLFDCSEFGNEDTFIYDTEGNLIKNIHDNGISLHGGEEFGVLLLENSNSSKFTMIDEFGKEICSFAYMYCPYEDADYFYVRKDSSPDADAIQKYGIVNHKGKALLDIKYDEITFQESTIIVKLANKISVLSKDLSLKFDLPNAATATRVDDQSLLVSYPKDKWNVIDNSGKVLLNYTAKKFESYRKDIFKVNKGEQDYFINIKGQIIDL